MVRNMASMPSRTLNTPVPTTKKQVRKIRGAMTPLAVFVLVASHEQPYHQGGQAGGHWPTETARQRGSPRRPAWKAH